MNLSSLLALHRSGESSDCLNCYLNSSVFNPCAMKNAMTLLGHRGCINTCSFNPYGEYELTGCDDGCVWLWDVGARNTIPKAMLAPHHTNVFTTNFLTGNRFISGGNDASVQVIEISEGRATTTKYENHHTRKVLCSFVIDENTFATCSHDRTVRLFDIRTSYTNQKIEELPLLSQSDFEYDGHERLCTDLEKYHLRAQNSGGGLMTRNPITTDAGSLLLDLRSLPDADFYTMDIHPIDRKRFITSGSDGTVRMFDLRMIKQQKAQNVGFGVNQYYRQQKSVTGAAFDSTGDRIAATVIDGSIHVIETAAAVDLSTIPQPPPPRPMFYSRSRHNRHGDNRRGGGTIDISLLIDEETGEFNLARLPELLAAQHQNESGDDANNDNEEEEEEEAEEAVEQLPVTGQIIELKDGHQSMETIKAVNWFGDYVVTGSDDGRVYFYDVNTGKVVQILSGHRGNVNVVAVHREKELLSTSGIDDFAILWEPMEIGKCDLEEITEKIQQTMRENPVEDDRYRRCSIC